MSEEQLCEVERKIRFEKMQQTEFSALKDVKGFNRFFRKGQVGSWKEYFMAQSEVLNRLYEKRIGSSGLAFRVGEILSLGQR